MHRDIKPANILCETQNVYKLADFGVSRVVGHFLSQQGTLEYMAPEVHDGATYSFPADMWSLGVVLFESMSGLSAGRPGVRPGAAGRKWCKQILEEYMSRFRTCEKIPAMEGTYDFALISLIGLAMLGMEPLQRMSAQTSFDAAQHLWDGLVLDEESDAGSGVRTPTQAHRNGSLAQDAPGSQVNDEAGGAASKI